KLELEVGDNAKVAAAAANAPEEFAVFRLARAHHTPIRGDHLDRQQVVTTQTPLVTQPAKTAAERQPGYPRIRYHATGRHQPIGLRRPIQLTPGAARFDTCNPH